MTSNFYMKNSILNDEDEDKLSRENTDKWIFRLLLLVIAISPILIGGAIREVVSPQISSIGQLTTGTKGDIYTFYKLIFLITITVIAVTLFTCKILFMNGEIRKTKLNILIGIFILAILVSTIFSPNSTIALWGKFNRSDGALSYICYTILFFIAYNIRYPKNALSLIMYTLTPFVLINFFMIIMNFTGNDLLSYSITQTFISLLLPESSFIGNESILIGTLNQWNYMSGMFAVMTLLYLSWAIIDSKIYRSYFSLIISIVSFSIMIMSLSTSGFLTFLVIIPLIIFLIIKSINRKKSIIQFTTFALISFGILSLLSLQNPRVWDESIGFITKVNPFASSDQQLSYQNKAYAAESEFELPVLPESGLSAGTGRTYIWGKTFDLIADRPLLGYGLDTLMYHFPHFNIDARAGLSSELDIVDKPHNMYIGILYGTGLIGFIGFIGLVIITAITSIKTIIQKNNNLIVVICIALIAFLFQALFNDSVPGITAPMLTLAGIMMGFIMNENSEQKEMTE